MATALDRVTPFRNEAIRTFSDPAERASLEGAIERARAAFQAWRRMKGR